MSEATSWPCKRAADCLRGLFSRTGQVYRGHDDAIDVVGEVTAEPPDTLHKQTGSNYEAVFLACIRDRTICPDAVK